MDKWFSVAAFLPEKELCNEELQVECPNFSPEYASKKLGIDSRHIATSETCVDMAYFAVQSLAKERKIDDVDLILFVTQSPDFIMPSMSCVLQGRLGLSCNIAAMDVNLGCSGYVYGLSTAVAYLKSGMSKKVLLVTSDTYSKYIKKEDYNNRAIFGDGATATLLAKDAVEHIGPFVFGTDGSGFDTIITYNSINRIGSSESGEILKQGFQMNGSAVMHFALQVVPKVVKELLEKNNMKKEDIDYYIFHQGNQYMLKNIQRILKIEDEKLIIQLKECGNTVSSSIPIAIRKGMVDKGINLQGKNVLLSGFGVGLSYAGVILRF